MEAQPVRFLPLDEITVFVRMNPFDVGSRKETFPIGTTVSEILETFDIKEEYMPIVFVGDWLLFKNEYEKIRPKAQSVVSVSIVPKKKAVRFVVPVIAAALAGPIAGALLGPGIISGSLFGATLITGLTKAAVGFALNSIGNLLVNAVAPPATPKLTNPNLQLPSVSPVNNITKESQTYFIQGATNRETQSAPVPVLLGRHRLVPPLAAKNYTESAGSKVYSRQLFMLSQGKLNISNERLGETALSSFQGVSGDEILDGNSSSSISLYPSIVNQVDLNIKLTNSAGWVRQTTSIDTDEIEVMVIFQGGLVKFDKQNKKQSQSVSYEVRYSVTGLDDWVAQSFTANAAQTSAVIKTHTFDVSRDQYDVEIRRTTGDTTDVQIRDEMSWTSIKSFKIENPVNRDGVCLKALRIQGSEQLNGSPDQYNVVGEQTEPLDWNGSAWVEGFTQNPASLYRYVLQNLGKTDIPDAQIDLAALQEWHEFCDAKGLTYNVYIDYQTTREQVLNEIAAAGMASPLLRDGKYSIVVDSEKEDIVQLITPRNSFDYSFEKIFQDTPHGLKVTFLDEDEGYFQNEITVYDDGYDDTNATRFESIDFPGVTSRDNIHRLARHHLAVMRLRPVVHVVTMDFENLVCTKGDRVTLAHDVPLIGLKWGRIKSIGASSITLDEEVTIEGSKLYGVRIRKTDGEQVTANVTNSAGTYTELHMSVPAGIAEGDLVVFGERGEESIDCIVQSIQPANDFQATLKLVDYSPAVFEASEGEIPEYVAPVTLPAEFTRPEPPEFVSVITDEAAQVINLDGSVSSRMVVNVINNNPYPCEAIVNIQRAGTDDFEFADTLGTGDNKIIIENLVQGEIYNLRIRYRRLVGAVLSNTISEPLLINGIVFLGTSQPPPDVENFDITVKSDSVFLRWSPINVIDLDYYEIRFQPVTSGATWGSALSLIEIPKDTNTATVTSRIGTYLIRAFDKQGNYSENATLAVTTIGQLDGLNAVETINEHTLWGGTFNGTAVSGGNLRLGSTAQWDDLGLWDDLDFWDNADGVLATQGVYNFEDIVDLGAVYTSTVSAEIEVSGANLSNLWDDLGLWDDIETWDGTDPSQYNVELQIRTTDDDPNGSPVTWSSWRKLEIGEYTARGYEFRLVLGSLNIDVTPVVSKAIVEIDAPDRIESGDDIASGTGGKAVIYSNSFSPSSNPAIAISADDMDTGDYYVLTSKTNAGFNIEFFNSSDVSKDVTFSYVAKGFGLGS